MDYFDRIADEWRSRAKELAAWTMAHLVNRTDVWGRYLGPRAGESTPGVVTAPFKAERGKVFLSESSLAKHFQTRKPSGILNDQPEVFPGKPRRGHHYGNWLRLPGRHHSRPHYSRVWNDEPWTDEPWLAGNDAVDRILATRLVAPESAAKLHIARARRTVCLDFDGVIHSYSSGWRGEEVIPDPPVHGTKEAIERLRRIYKVVVHSSRCRTEEGRRAIAAWLKKHAIEVDEVCEHKPPAMVYLDDRAVRFRGDWDEAMAAIGEFRK